MRYVSWAVVVISIGLVGAWLARNELPTSSSLAVEAADVAATVVRPSPPAQLGPVALAQGYTEAWNSHDPARVAGFFAPDASITINDGEPYLGIAGVEQMATEFFTTFPDIQVFMDDLTVSDEQVVYHWTFTGTHAVTDKPVRISGTETWRMATDGLIAASTGHFDAADYARQVGETTEP